MLLFLKGTQKKVAMQWKCKELSAVILSLFSTSESRNGMKMKTIFGLHSDFVSKVKVRLLLLVLFLKVAIPRDGKGLSNCIFGLFSHFFESRNSMKTKRSFNFNLALFSQQSQSGPFTDLFKSSNSMETKGLSNVFPTLFSHFFKSRNSMKMKRTFNCAF